jgi:hypothetical protein
MRPRYEIRQGEGDRWSVIDIFTSKPAFVNGNRLAGKSRENAQALAEALNAREAKQYGKDR